MCRGSRGSAAVVVKMKEASLRLPRIIWSLGIEALCDVSSGRGRGGGGGVVEDNSSGNRSLLFWFCQRLLEPRANRTYQRRFHMIGRWRKQAEP